MAIECIVEFDIQRGLIIKYVRCSSKISKKLTIMLIELLSRNIIWLAGRGPFRLGSLS